MNLRNRNTAGTSATVTGRPSGTSVAVPCILRRKFIE